MPFRREQQTAHACGAAGSSPTPRAPEEHRETAGYSQRIVWSQTGKVVGFFLFVSLTFWWFIRWRVWMSNFQGLLQKQRELERSYSPLLQGQSRTHSPAFQPPWEKHTFLFYKSTIYTSTLPSTANKHQESEPFYFYSKLHTRPFHGPWSFWTSIRGAS